MAEQTVWPTAIVLAVLLVALLGFGVIAGHVAWPKVVTNTVDKPVNVVKEVPVEKIVTVQNVTVVDKSAVAFSNAKDEFLAEVEDNEDYQVCDGETYDFNQLSFKYYDNWKVYTEGSRHPSTFVNFDVRVKYTDKDVETKCYQDYSVEVEFPDNENPVVTIN